MICNIPKVTVTTWSSNNVLLVGPTYRQFLNKSLSVVENSDVASIIGQPGMGKTTILRKVQQILEDKKYVFYLDLASKGEIEEEFWNKIDLMSLKEIVIRKMDKKKYGYSFWKKLFGVSFEKHLGSLCGKMNDSLLRIFCGNYTRDFDGMLRLLRDLKEVVSPVLLIDEVRDHHLQKIHRLINSGLNIPVLMAIPTDAYSKVSDLAIRRRLDESRISLDNALTSDDIKEIVEAYCKDLSDILYPIVLSLWNGKEINTVSSILQYIRSEIDKAESFCKENIGCIREKIKESYTLKDVAEDSRSLEKMMRESLISLAKEFNISYVHPRGKRVEVKGKTLTVGLFFIKDGLAYVGLVKLFNGKEVERDQEIELLSYIDKIEHEKKEYKVALKFLVTNVRLNINGVETVELPTLEAVRIIRGDSMLLEERLRSLLNSVSPDKKEEVVV